MLFYLILFFTLIPVIELAILIEVGRHIGVLYTVAVVLLTGVVGAILARTQGFMILARIRSELESGIMPADKLFDGILILTGGILLLTPGFLTDITGFILLIPPTRSAVKKIIKRRIHIKQEFRGGYIDVDRL